MREILAAAAFAAAVLGGVGWLMSGVNLRLDAIDGHVMDLQQRVTRVESLVEIILERLPPRGGRPARSNGSGGGGAPCDDGSRRDSVTLIERAPSADCGAEEAR